MPQLLVACTSNSSTKKVPNQWESVGRHVDKEEGVGQQMDSRNGDISLRKASRLFSATGDEKQTDRILELDQNRTAKAEGATVGP